MGITSPSHHAHTYSHAHSHQSNSLVRFWLVIGNRRTQKNLHECKENVKHHTDNKLSWGLNWGARRWKCYPLQNHAAHRHTCCICILIPHMSLNFVSNVSSSKKNCYMHNTNKLLYICNMLIYVKLLNISLYSLKAYVTRYPTVSLSRQCDTLQINWSSNVKSKMLRLPWCVPPLGPLFPLISGGVRSSEERQCIKTPVRWVQIAEQGLRNNGLDWISHPFRTMLINLGCLDLSGIQKKRGPGFKREWASQP